MELGRKYQFHQLSYIKDVPDLEDKENGLLPEAQLNDLRSLITSMATMCVTKGNNIEVKVDQMQELTERYQADMTAMCKQQMGAVEYKNI